MKVVDFIRSYQSYDPETGLFNKWRTAQEYAWFMGVTPSVLSRFYSGQRPRGAAVLRGFLRTFPGAAQDLARAMAEQEARDAVAV